MNLELSDKSDLQHCEYDERGAAIWSLLVNTVNTTPFEGTNKVQKTVKVRGRKLSDKLEFETQITDELFHVSIHGEYFILSKDKTITQEDHQLINIQPQCDGGLITMSDIPVGH